MKHWFFVGLVICAAIVPDTSWTQSKPEPEQKFILEPNLLGEYLLDTGDHLRKAYKRSEREEFWWTLCSYTVGRFLKGFTAPYHVGCAGEKLIGASTVISSQRAPLMEIAGKELKSYRTLGSLNRCLVWGGLLTVVFGGQNKAIPIAGGLAVLTGEGIGVLAPRRVGSAGKALEEISGAFPSATQRKLMKEAGKSLQSYTTCTYWGWGLQGVGVTTAIIGFAGENKEMGATGIVTTLVGMIICDMIAPMNIQSAGERLEELGNIL